MDMVEGRKEGVECTLEAAQGAPRDPRRDSRGERLIFEASNCSMACF